MKRRRSERGQVLVIAGLVAFLVCGVIALAIDFAVLTNQHRNIQAFVDEAVIGGASQLNPSGSASLAAREQNARRTAFIYLRDNLVKGGGASASPILMASLSTCWGSTSATQFAADIKGCTLPAPYDNYTVTICAPAEDSGSGTPCANPISSGTSISMRVSESVATGFANLFGVATTTSGGFGAADISGDANNSYGSGSAGSGNGSGSSTAGGSQSTTSGTTQVKSNRFPFGLWSDSCLTIHDLLEVFAADVYVNKCSLVTSNPVGGAVCVESTPGSAGNFIFGPTAVIPTNPVPSVSQNLANCTGATGGAIVSMGQVSQDTLGQWTNPPAYAPPPGWGANPAPSPWPGAASHTNRCWNGTRTSVGGQPSNCYNPGTYSEITDIKNNLNPGVYNIVGPDRSSTIPACDTNVNGCQSVIFTGDTMNANWADVGDRCWTAPNNPTTGVFNWPCPDGYVLDPQANAVTDSQCSGGSYNSRLGAPAVAATASLVPGSLSALVPYFVRVTQNNAMGESTSSEVTVAAGVRTSIDVGPMPAAAGVTYNVYISQGASASQTVGNNEILAASGVLPAATTHIAAMPAATATPYPLFDTTACVGFRNIPSRPPAYPQPQSADRDQLENYGVTFNLYYGTSMCFDNVCGGSDHATVLLSPFCGSLWNTNAQYTSSGTPPAHYGTSCFPKRDQYEADPSAGPVYTGGGWINDGAYVVYSSSKGKIWAMDSRERLGFTGAIYAPAMRLSITRSTTFNLIGQAFVSSVELGTKPSYLAPLIYYPCCALATTTGNTSGGAGGGAGAASGGFGNGGSASGGIIGPQAPVVVRLIR